MPQLLVMRVVLLQTFRFVFKPFFIITYFFIIFINFLFNIILRIMVKLLNCWLKLSKRLDMRGRSWLEWILPPVNSSRMANMTLISRTLKPKKRTGLPLTSFWRCTKVGFRYWNIHNFHLTSPKMVFIIKWLFSILGFIKDYPVVSIEDPFDQDDWEGYAKLTASTSIQIVGDDLLVTNPKRISTAIEKKACNGLLLKVAIHYLISCISEKLLLNIF